MLALRVPMGEARDMIERVLRIADLRDADDDARAAAVRASARLGKAAVAPLTKALGNADPKVRLGAIEALEALGPDARPAHGVSVTSDSRVRSSRACGRRMRRAERNLVIRTGPE